MDSQGTVWAGTSTGLWQVGSNHLMRVDGLDGTQFGLINALVLDREGNLFIGTASQGLFCLQPKRFRTYTRKDGLADDDVWSVAASRDGSVWVGTEAGLSHLTAQGWKSYGTAEGLITDRVRSVFEDSTGTLWVGTDSTSLGSNPGDLHHFQGGRFIPVSRGQGFTSADISCICEDSRGNLWVNGGAGLHELSNGVLHATYDAAGTMGYAGTFCFVDRDDNLWIGGSELDCLRGRHRIRYDIHTLIGGGVYGVVHQDENGALWLGSSQHGIVRLKDGKLRAITTSQGLFSDLVLSLQDDGLGNFWMNSHTGIFRASKKDLNAVADGTRPSLQCVAYGLEDGLLSVEGNGGTLPNSCKAPDGRLWFPTTKGVSVVDPAQTAADDLPPRVILQALSADGKMIFHDQTGAASNELPLVQSPNLPASTFHGSAETTLPPGRGRSLEIEFCATTLVHSDRVMFRYRLAGRDRNWIDVGTQRFVSFQDLPAGHYTFLVTACNRHGVWNDAGARLSFQIAPFFYQTWPFYSICVGFGTLMVSGLVFYRLSVQRRMLRLQHQAALAEERERIARDLHDDLGANLTRIALLTEVVRKQLPEQHAAGGPLEHVSGMARQAVDGMSELIWMTNSRYDTLGNLVAYLREYAARFFAGAPLDCRIDFPAEPGGGSLSANFRKAVFLVLKEALNNIQKHSGATRVDVRLRVKDHQMELTVGDNGQGFDLPQTAQLAHGLANMRHRTQSLGGTMHSESDPGRGTIHRFEFPLPAERG